MRLERNLTIKNNNEHIKNNCKEQEEQNKPQEIITKIGIFQPLQSMSQIPYDYNLCLIQAA